jgi:hypothetical protein
MSFFNKRMYLGDDMYVCLYRFPNYCTILVKFGLERQPRRLMAEFNSNFKSDITNFLKNGPPHKNQ